LNHRSCVALFNELLESGLVLQQLFKLCSCAAQEVFDDRDDLLLRQYYFRLLLVAPVGNLLQNLSEYLII